MKLITIFAHPDDETMLTGGVLALLRNSGVEMFYFCATRGEGGELGEPPVSSREEIGDIREIELHKAVEALGGGQIEFMGFIDPLVGVGEKLYPYTNDVDGLLEKIRNYLDRIKPDAVITHGVNGEYGHPGHILTHTAVRSVVESLGNNGPTLYTFCADFPDHPRPRHANPDNPAHIILDVSSVMDQKIKAAYSHRSQNALFLRRRSNKAGYTLTVPEILLPIESLHRVLPITSGIPKDRVIETLKPWRRK